MKVSELIGHLQKFDPELEVWTAIDDEGNGFNSVRYDPEERYVPKEDSYRSDECHTLEDLLDEDPIFGGTPEIGDYKKVVLI
jgi:hypothetical protein